MSKALKLNIVKSVKKVINRSLDINIFDDVDSHWKSELIFFINATSIEPEIKNRDWILNMYLSQIIDESLFTSLVREKT